MARRCVLALVVVAVTLVASCSSSSNKSKQNANVPQSWDPVAVARLNAAGRQFAREMPGECKKMDPVLAASELPGIRRVGDTVFPKAMGTCTILGENEEIAVFADAATRDKWVNERARLFCANSKRKNIGLPGLHWDTGGTWSLLADTEGVGRRIARATKSTYVGTPCPGELLDWDPGAVAQVQGLADKFTAAGLGCADFMVEDLDQERQDPQFAKIGLPATIGTCTLRGTANNTVIIAATRPGSLSLQTLVDTTSKGQCPTLPASAIVVGRDWAVLTERDVVARRLARIVGGTVHLCPQ
jgi:hypothetical protein